MKPKLAYFAGFFDGEGSVSIAKPEGTSLYLLRCVVTNTDATVLHFFKERFGGSVKGPYRRNATNAKPVFHWNADAKVAAKFLVAVLPYLVIKRQRALLGLRFRNLFRGENVVPRGLARNPEKRDRILRRRREFYDQMRLLNKRGASCQVG